MLSDADHSVDLLCEMSQHLDDGLPFRLPPRIRVIMPNHEQVKHNICPTRYQRYLQNV